jgi:hypothetical protein
MDQINARAPLAIDLFCGLGGWTEGLLAEGYDVVGFDIERHQYGDHHYPGQLVLQDVCSLVGAQFVDAALIVASPPCQEYSYMAMPWTRAKERAAKYRSGELDVADLTRLFDAAVRIGREAGVPTVIENVRGAQPWIGRSRWNYGSYHLWGDVPALMPMTLKREAVKIEHREDIRRGAKVTPHLTNAAEHFKNDGGSWFAVSHNNVAHSRGDEIKCGRRLVRTGRRCKRHATSEFAQHQAQVRIRHDRQNSLDPRPPYRAGLLSGEYCQIQRRADRRRCKRGRQ